MRVEDLTERAIAEWGMIHSDESESTGGETPLADQPRLAVPQRRPLFRLRTPRRRARRLLRRARLRHALDAAFDPSETPMQKLEILAEVLLTFLASLEDGVVTASMWAKLEEGIVAREKARVQVDREEEKMWAMEILSTSPPHNATFLLLTSMLQRVGGRLGRGEGFVVGFCGCECECECKYDCKLTECERKGEDQNAPLECRNHPFPPYIPPPISYS